MKSVLTLSKQWLFILTGIPAVLFGAIVWKWMPDYPQDAKFLTDEERAFAVARMGPFAPQKEDKTFDFKVAKQTLLEPLFWVYATSYFFMVNSLNAFSYFSPTIIANLGFSGYVAQLLTVPPNVLALIIIVGNCVHSDYSKERIGHSLGALIFVGTGYLLLALLTNWIGRYVAVFMIACTNAAVMPFLAHRTATVSGSTATALATGVTIAFSNCGGISAPFLFPGSDGPNYLTGNVSLRIPLFNPRVWDNVANCSTSGLCSACCVPRFSWSSTLVSGWESAQSTVTSRLERRSNWPKPLVLRAR